MENNNKKIETKDLIKYSLELKKIGLIDSIRTIEKTKELKNNEEIKGELYQIKTILTSWFDDIENNFYGVEIEKILGNYFDNYDKYRQDTLNKNFLGLIEEQINKGNITVETIEKVLAKYKEKTL